MTERKISADDKLRAMALFFLAKENYAAARALELSMMRLLGQDDQGAVSDCLYDDGAPNTGAAFESALKQDGFVVEDHPHD